MVGRVAWKAPVTFGWGLGWGGVWGWGSVMASPEAVGGGRAADPSTEAGSRSVEGTENGIEAGPTAGSGK